MRVAIITTDNREHFKKYDLDAPWLSPPIDALLDGFQAIENSAAIQVHVLSCTQRPMRSPEKLSENVFFHSLYVPKIGWLRTGYQGCIRAIRRKLKEIQPDLVHGQGTERECSISAVFSGFPNVLTIHGNIRTIAKLSKAKPFTFWWLAARLESFTLPRSGGVVCITHHTQSAVASLARRTWVVPNAVDEQFFEVRSNPNPNDIPTILCVGHICALKNQNAFIRALDPLAGKHRFKVVFLGKAEKGHAYCDEFFELTNARPWCSFLGVVGQEAVKDWLRQASLLVLPTMEDNCPMVVLEAMAAGVPVLASKVGGVPDLIEDGVTGLFCEPSAPKSIQEGVARLVEHRDFRLRLAAAAREKALARFHPSVVARQHMDVYRDLLRSS